MTEQLSEYQQYPESVKQLIKEARALSQQNLTYLYGSADPKNKGMDCSGTMYYLLNKFKLTNVPRSSNQMYQWVWEKGKFHAVNGNDLNSFEFSQLKPGDLLFWVGTYNIKRNPPITHVMLYLGKDKQNRPLMFGASDGRTYHAKSMWGVSVFDFQPPPSSSSARFVGYGCIPGLTCS